MAIIINAENTIAGRLASIVAKRLLRGEEIVVVNAKKAIVMGNPVVVVKNFQEKVARGDPYHGPFYPKRPERILRRMIRGMLPYKKAKGREAFRRVKVYAGVPEEFAGKPMETPEKAKKEPTHKFIYLGDIARKLGVKDG